jgi:hypothetical protein
MIDGFAEDPLTRRWKGCNQSKLRRRISELGHLMIHHDSGKEMIL